MSPSSIRIAACPPMARLRRLLGLALCIGTVALAGCSGDDDAPAPVPTPPTTVGPQGGTVDGPGGTKLAVAAGTLASDVTLRIEQSSAGAPPVPGTIQAASPTYAMTPHGAVFARPIRIRVPFDPGTAPDADHEPVLHRAQPGGTWETLDGVQRDGDSLVADVTSFSYYSIFWCTKETQTRWVGGRPYTSSTGNRICGRSPGQTTFEIVDPAPPPTPPAPPLATLTPVDPALQVAAPGFVTFRATMTYPQGWYGLKDVRLKWRLLYNARVVAASGEGGFNARGNAQYDDFSVDVPVALTEADNGLRTYWFEFYCDIVSGNNCLAGTGDPPTPYMAAFTMVSQPRLVRIAIPPGTAAPAAVMPLVTEQHWLPYTSQDQWGTRYFSIEAWAFSNVAAVHTWQLSADGGQTWQDQALDYADPVHSRIALERRDAQRSELNGVQARVRVTNPFGTATGAAMTFVAPQDPVPPTISAQPADQSVLVGQTASFTVAAGGVPTPAVQWQRRAAAGGTWADVAGATASTYTTAPLTLADHNVQFRAVLANDAGSVTSDAVLLTVNEAATAPVVTTQPVSQSVAPGGTAVFAAAATGTAPFSYQWRRNGVDIVGANAPILTLPAVDVSAAGDYTLAIANMAGSVVTNTATLSVVAGGPAPASAPAIVTQPAGVTVGTGSTASFAIGVTGSGPLAYEWRRNGSPIAGANGAVLSIVDASAADVGSYTVVVSNGVGSAASDAAALSVTPDPQPAAPVIGTQPTGLVVLPGASATFGVAASGSGALAYQWRLNGADLPGATAPVLTLASVAGADAGSYTVVVTNAAGSATSAPAMLVVVGAPAITAHPVSQTVSEGQEAVFSVTASGDGLRYQWTRNGLAIPGADGASYTTPATTAADNGAVFAVVVYNGAGIQFSGGALLSVVGIGPPPATPVLIGNGIGDATAPPSVAMDGSGNAVVVWSQHDGAWYSIYGIRFSAGSGWGATSDVEAASGNASNPQVAMDAGGNATAVWYSGNVYGNRADAAGNWDGAGLLSDAVGLASAPSVAMNGAGDAMAVWHQFDGSSDKPYARRYTAGGGWEAVQTIGAGAANARVAMDASGHAIAVWRQVDGGTYGIFAARYTPGVGWSVPQAIDDSASEAVVPDIAMSSGGDAVVVWSQVDGAVQGVHAARYTPAGGWEPAQVLDTGTAYATNPQVAMDGSGNAIAVWRQYDGSRHRIYTRRLAAGGSWDATVQIESPAGSDAWEPFVAQDASGRAIAIWLQWQSTTFGVFVNRYTPGSGWGTAELLADATDNAQTPRVAIDATGRAIAAWLQSEGTRNEVFAMVFAF